ncbi:MAG: acetyl-CoA C-acyltransferase [Thermomicrobiales bacterium]|jgi:acetyl-CoA C-acetyltransferase|nr:MAG: acetyl-CoA C-acyltransferase [Thermomicrobiales bacterium]
MSDPVVIVSAVRTPMGAFLGELAGASAPFLGATAIGAAVRRSGLIPAQVDEVLMGCVLPAGLGQAPARQAALQAGLPDTTACTGVSKVCGSGMKAIMLAHDQLRADTCNVVVAGGMESMSNAPYLAPKARKGCRLGHATLLDHMFLDGLEDAYANRGRLMGEFAEDCADELGISREEQDRYAGESLRRAQAAAADGSFEWEIEPVTLPAPKRGSDAVQVRLDEQPRISRIERIPTLKPAFRPDGSVTAANSSSISDGAAALVMTRLSTARELGLTPIARICAHATSAGEPRRFPTAPVGAITKVLGRAGWNAGDVDLYEINEAFAVVAIAAIRMLGLPAQNVNPHGGACALGHPIGASGARIVVSLIAALRSRGLRRGVASLCIGGGEATALALEMER